MLFRSRDVTRVHGGGGKFRLMNGSEDMEMARAVAAREVVLMVTLSSVWWSVVTQWLCNSQMSVIQFSTLWGNTTENW